MNLLLFLILRILSNPIANVFQKKLAVDNSSFMINFYSYLILSLLCLPFCPKYLLQIPDVSYWAIVLTAGLLCASGTACTIKAVSIGELSVLGPINSYKSIIGLVSSFILLKEIPSILGIIGMVLIIWGSKFIFSSSQDGFSFKLFLRKDIQLRLLALLLTGTEAALLKKIILLSSVEMCFILWCFMGLLWSFVFAFISRKNFVLKGNSVFVQIVYIALLIGIMEYSTNYVFERINVGYALSLFQLSTLVTVFLGYKIFNEKDIKNKIIGSLIMIVGSCLIILH